MTPREIVAEAWTITKKEVLLRRWGFAAALFETLRNVELILYQGYFLYWYFKGVTVGWLSVEVLFFESLPLWLFITVTVLLVILLILELFVPTLATGAIIGLAAKSYRKEEVKGGLVLALYNFFPMLEIHGLFLLSSFTTVFTVWSFILRYGGGELKYGAMAILIIVWTISTLFHLFSSFAEEGVVIRKLGVFTSVGRSFKLILSHLGHVMFLFILMVVISLRILLNASMIFLIPGIAIGFGLFLALFLPTSLSVIIATIVGLTLLVILSYFLAYLHIFKQTVWTLTYMELSKLKDLDIIEE
ncbi:MAG: hypothetical protein Q7R81_04650 [Candidatus Peregrinibacteria bacterium]|nr:hypothetical protein [Candidatus Peregrinibacteria bacterium]